MCGLYEAAAQGQGGADDFGNPEVMYTDGRPYNIDNGINGSDLMKVDLFLGGAMDARLGLGHEFEDFKGADLGCFVNTGMFD